MAKRKVKNRRYLTGQTPDSNTVIKIDRPNVNRREGFTVVPVFADGTQPNLQGQEGTYKVTYVLSIPGKEVFKDDLNFTRLLSSGDSLLALPPNTDHLKIDLRNEDGTLRGIQILLRKNGKGFLSLAEMRINSDTFGEAEATAHDAIHPLLSTLSFQYDVALDVAGYHILHEETHAQRMVFGLVGKVKSIDGSQLPMSSPKFRLLMSAYREGLNATNPFYKLLSFYRVVEGSKNIRASRKRDVLASGDTWRDPRERIPETASGLPEHSQWIVDLFLPYLGKKFTSVIDELRSICRNAIAHLDPEQDVLVADRYADMSTCESAIPVLQYIAREMLREELRH